MSLSVETLAVAKKYTDDSIAGAGALAGKPCQIQSITDITGGHRVTFLWKDNSNVDHTSTMDVMDGADGKGIKAVSVNASNHLIITYSDDTTSDAGEIEIHSAVNSVNGKTGTVVLSANDVDALPNDTAIPSKTSDLTNDSNFISTSETAGLLKNDGTVNTTIVSAVSSNTSAINGIKDGTTIDSFGDVEDALPKRLVIEYKGAVTANTAVVLDNTNNWLDISNNRLLSLDLVVKATSSANDPDAQVNISASSGALSLIPKGSGATSHYRVVVTYTGPKITV